MRNSLFLSLLILFVACDVVPKPTTTVTPSTPLSLATKLIKVNNNTELSKAIAEAEPGAEEYPESAAVCGV